MSTDIQHVGYSCAMSRGAHGGWPRKKVNKLRNWTFTNSILINYTWRCLIVDKLCKLCVNSEKILSCIIAHEPMKRLREGDAWGMSS